MNQSQSHRTSSPAPFVVESATATIDTLLQDSRHHSGDIHQDWRHQRLLAESARRACTREGSEVVSPRLTLECAAERYYWLAATGRSTLSGRFTQDELVAMLNTECTTFWGRYERDTMLTMVVETFTTPPEALVKKLRSLSWVENEALLDLCETIWRTGDMDTTLADMGVTLAPAA